MELEQQQIVPEMKSVPALSSGFEKTSACFDCSICLDFASDPVVTLCGHLYCWPCIYKWLEFQRSSLSSEECCQCPVCKAEISPESVVPLYGRGQSLSQTEPADKTVLKLIIPPRPTAFPRQAQATSSTLRQRVQDEPNSPNPAAANSGEANSPDLSNLGSPMPLCHPMCGNYGEMVYARVFGNSESFYTYPYSYHTQGSMSPRLRRQEIQTSKSLNRISFFVFCCILLCLFLF
ncbi:OLC1v1021535C1 [Oldenlandia corymbosa var. corymbosa]|uniref:E3 ubiquitin-protein ligase RMA n=1 Tax=Oldenlandia corymbosa var. corymbosa TaxID=529605 RepID=A0AAV1BY56_OLDCO|nr:OLC1v1021535C1 [Oldenlandia corymbosa var. corymbosa]